MAYSRMEHETSIVWDDEEKVARIYTASPVSMRKLDKLCEDYPAEYRKVWEEKDADGNDTEVPVHKWSHGPDALRYALFSEFAGQGGNYTVSFNR
mgnify:CR=1 FL=1